MGFNPSDHNQMVGLGRIFGDKYFDTGFDRSQRYDIHT